MRTFALAYVRGFLLAAAVSLIFLPFACVPVKAGEIESCVAIRAMEPRLPAGVQRAWGQPSKFWPQRSVLRVRFLSGTARQKAEAWKRFEHIDALVGLSFRRVETGASDIRVRFDKGKGHWSYMGTDARLVPSNAATMNIDLRAGVFGDGAEEWDRVGLHEPLHAIGLEHEHQHPRSTIRWNKPVVYADYAAQQGWSKEQVDFQVINRSDAKNYIFTNPDGNSILQYPVPPGHANIVIGWNVKLSPADVAFLAKIYPQ